MRPTLEAIELWSEASERLVMGTAAHESAGFRYVRQLGGGPALSLWQIEPATYRDLMINTLPGLRPGLRARFAALFPAPGRPCPDPSQLVRDLALGAAVCRLLYYRHPDPLPAAYEIERLAELWKRVYNTPAGAGSPAAWLQNFRLYCTWYQ